jgi:hypothetical protein
MERIGRIAEPNRNARRLYSPLGFQSNKASDDEGGGEPERNYAKSVSLSVEWVVGQPHAGTCHPDQSCGQCAPCMASG